MYSLLSRCVLDVVWFYFNLIWGRKEKGIFPFCWLILLPFDPTRYHIIKFVYLLFHMSMVTLSFHNCLLFRKRKQIKRERATNNKGEFIVSGPSVLTCRITLTMIYFAYCVILLSNNFAVLAPESSRRIFESTTVRHTDKPSTELWGRDERGL